MNKEKTCGASLAGTAVSSPQLRAPLKDQTVGIKDELLLPGWLWFVARHFVCAGHAARCTCTRVAFEGRRTGARGGRGRRTAGVVDQSSMHTLTRFWVVYVFSVAVVCLRFAHIKAKRFSF